MVEYKLPKLGVASSNLVARSIIILVFLDKSRFFVHMVIILRVVYQSVYQGRASARFSFLGGDVLNWCESVKGVCYNCHEADLVFGPGLPHKINNFDKA